MLVIDDLTFRLGDRMLLDHASVQLPGGARLGLVGRNGVGKTTLFRLLTGELPADEVVGLEQPGAPVGGGGTQPTRSDDRERGVGRGEGLVDCHREVAAGADGGHVVEDLIAPQTIDQRVAQSARMPADVVAPVAQKDPHGSPTTLTPDSIRSR